jgi:hypothetical protein
LHPDRRQAILGIQPMGTVFLKCGTHCRTPRLVCDEDLDDASGARTTIAVSSCLWQRHRFQ